MNRKIRSRLACACVALGAVQFAALAGAAMWYYPGGTVFDDSTSRYSFWTNSFSDLGRQVSISGVSNGVSAACYHAALILLVCSFVPLWFVLPSVMPNSCRIAGAMRFAGLLSIAGMIGVALTPADVHAYWHMLTIGIASVPALVAVGLCLAGMFADPACPGAVTLFTLGLAGVAGLHFGQYVHHFWLDGPWTPAATAVQKVLAIYVLLWLAFMSAWMWRRLAPCGSASPPIQSPAADE